MPKLNLDELRTPAQANVEGITLIIREVHKVDTPWDKSYIVACQIKDGNWISHIFHLYPKNTEEFIRMVKEEIKNYKRAEVYVGTEVIRKV